MTVTQIDKENIDFNDVLYNMDNYCFVKMVENGIYTYRLDGYELSEFKETLGLDNVTLVKVSVE